MLEHEFKLLYKNKTQLKYIGRKKNMQSIKSNWITTDFAYNLQDEMMLIVQPLVNNNGESGTTGLNARALTKQELLNNFELVWEVDVIIQTK